MAYEDQHLVIGQKVLVTWAPADAEGVNVVMDGPPVIKVSPSNLLTIEGDERNGGVTFVAQNTGYGVVSFSGTTAGMPLQEFFNVIVTPNADVATTFGLTFGVPTS
jgi:hypothetical protein